MTTTGPDVAKALVSSSRPACTSVRRYFGEPEYQASRSTGCASATRCGGSTPVVIWAALYRVIDA